MFAKVAASARGMLDNGAVELVARRVRLCSTREQPVNCLCSVALSCHFASKRNRQL
jgi:hypothetical protein